MNEPSNSANVRPELGLSEEHRWSPESAPNVDVALIRKYVRNELDDEASWKVAQLTSRFKTWHEAELRELEKLVDETGVGDEPETINSANNTWPPRRRQLAISVAVASVLVPLALFVLSQSSSEELLDGDSTIYLASSGDVAGRDFDSASLEKLVAETLLNERALEFEATAKFSLTVRSETHANQFRELVHPMNTSIFTSSPTIQWLPWSDGAEQYRVSIFDAESGLEIDVGKQWVDGYEWTVPIELVKGRLYAWECEAKTADGTYVLPADPMYRPRFSILETDDSAAIKTNVEKVGDSHLGRAILFAEAGLMSQAEVEYRLFFSDNPESKTAMNLYRSFLEQRYPKR